MISENQILKQRFFRLAFFNVLSNLTVPLASLIDIAFLGHLAEIRHLAGVALATILFNYIYWTFGFLRMGTTGTTAIAAGQKNENEVILTLLRNGAIALSLGIVIILLQYPLQIIGFAILSGTEAVKASGIDYYYALIWGAPATLLNFVLLGWFLGREKGAIVFILSAIAKVSNIILDYIFIVQLGWASAGAGSATAIGQYLAALFGLILVFKQFPLPKIRALFSKILDRDAILNSFDLNREIVIRTLFLITTFAAFTNISSGFGTNYLVTNTLLLQVVTLAAYFIDGLAFATETIAGTSRGSGAKELLLPLLKLSGGLSLILAAAISLVFALMPNLFQLLTNNTDAIAGVSRYVIWLFPVLIFGAIAFILDGYFIGLTEGAILRKSTAIGAIAFFSPVALIAVYFKANHLLWLALALFMLGRAITLAIAVKNTLKITAQRSL
ncbi:MAG: MATE family efflux transporter [Prochloraceae cyanobacterium]|nr:MATE family efflux transporter [Prochloraceae cyanobacterium]